MELARLGQLGDEGGGSHPADVGHALKNLDERAVVALDVAGHLGVGAVELGQDCPDHRLKAAARHGTGEPQPSARGKLHGDGLAARVPSGSSPVDRGRIARR